MVAHNVFWTKMPHFEASVINSHMEKYGSSVSTSVECASISVRLL